MATATVPAALSSDLQTLIDSRLDTIDRMLNGQVPRADRLAIVREVEAQIHDLLAERGSVDLDRRDILDILARLDPPEAYLGDDLRQGGAPIAPRPFLATSPRLQDRPQSVLFGKTSGVLGIVALTVVLVGVLCIPVAFLLQGELFFLAGAVFIGLGLILAVPGLIFSAADRLGNRWSVIGFVTGAIAMTLALFTGAASAYLFLIG